MAGSDYFLGRPRCPGALPDLSYGGRRSCRHENVFTWAKSHDGWHRRAACVALIRGARQKMFFPEITRLSALLFDDKSDMVQKGLGWLLRETAKADPKRTVPYLMRIRKNALRLVLRAACETLPPATKRYLLSPVRDSR